MGVAGTAGRWGSLTGWSVCPGPELLDGPLDDRSTLVGNLRDLRRANRWLGGARLSIRAVEAIAAQPDGSPAGDGPVREDPPTRPLTILDVGTGGADIPLALLDHAARAGRAGR